MQIMQLAQQIGNAPNILCFVSTIDFSRGQRKHASCDVSRQDFISASPIGQKSVAETDASRAAKRTA